MSPGGFFSTGTGATFGAAEVELVGADERPAGDPDDPEEGPLLGTPVLGGLLVWELPPPQAAATRASATSVTRAAGRMGRSDDEEVMSCSLTSA
jgi:hypothetical protein